MQVASLPEYIATGHGARFLINFPLVFKGVLIGTLGGEAPKAFANIRSILSCGK